MYKGKLDIGTIGGVRVTFNLILEGDPTGIVSKDNRNRTISLNKFQGNIYLTCRPRPFVTFDISTYEDKKNGWNNNSSVNLNKVDLFRFIKRGTLYLNKIKEYEEQLYILDEADRPIVEPSVVARLRLLEKIGGKAILIQPAMVPSGDVDSQDAAMENGFIFAINNISDFAYLTVDDFEFLIYILKGLNIYELSMQMINAYLTLNKVDVHKIESAVTETVETGRSDDTKVTRPGFFQKISQLPNI